MSAGATISVFIIAFQLFSIGMVVMLAIVVIVDAPDDVVAALRDDPDVRVRKEAEKRAKVRQ